jgi:A/G-specific adenine glycosylase
VVSFCATRGEHAAPPPPERRRRHLAYGLAQRNGSVYLVQRPADASLMPGMWELPQLPSPPRTTPVLTVRHAITTTDYTVSVYECARTSAARGRWTPLRRLSRLPITGLTRKVLRGLDALV